MGSGGGGGGKKGKCYYRDKQWTDLIVTLIANTADSSSTVLALVV